MEKKKTYKKASQTTSSVSHAVQLPPEKVVGVSLEAQRSTRDYVCGIREDVALYFPPQDLQLCHGAGRRSFLRLVFLRFKLRHPRMSVLQWHGENPNRRVSLSSFPLIFVDLLVV